MAATSDRVIDLLDGDLYAGDPYPTYAWLREHAPVYWDAQNELWGIARYDDIVRRVTNAVRVEGDAAHVEELDSEALGWLWNSNVRATALVLDGFVRRGDNATLVPGLVRWLLSSLRIWPDT